jgi:NADH:ubiquinone oxidoreductase subunit K
MIITTMKTKYIKNSMLGFTGYKSFNLCIKLFSAPITLSTAILGDIIFMNGMKKIELKGKRIVVFMLIVPSAFPAINIEIVATMYARK